MLNQHDNKSFVLVFLFAAFAYSVLSYVTYGYKPMYGETEVRGLLNQEPNIVHPEVYQQILSSLPNNQLLDVYECKDCFLPYSSIGKTQNLKNGFYRSFFQPKFFFEYENKKYPVLFADRIGGLTYSFVKVLKEQFSLFSALLFYHLMVGILVIYFFGYFVSRAYSLHASQIAMLLLAFSPLHIINNGNFISKKFETLIFWTMACAFYVSQNRNAIVLSIFSGLSVITVKSTTLMNIIGSFFLINYSRLRDHWKVILTAFVVIFISALALLARDYRGVYKEYYGTAEYVKEWKYLEAIILDSVLMVASPIKYMEYFLGLENWHFPFTTLTPTMDDYLKFHPWDRMKNWSLLYYIPIIFFILPIVFRKSFDFKNKYFKIYLALAVFIGCIFFAAHRYFTYSMYTIGSAGFIILVFALIYEDLWKRKSKVWAQFAIVIFSLVYLFQLFQFVDIYRKNGPILTFSYQAYEEIARDLELKKIIDPTLFFVSEMGNLENFSDQIKPIYVPDKMLKKIGDIFSFSKKSYLLLQMKPDWYESAWPKFISKNAILEQAKIQNVKLESIKEYTYRNELVYWLILFEHEDKNKFFTDKIKISEEVKNKIFENNAIWR